MRRDVFDNATKNSERVIINDRQQDGVAIRVDGEPKPDQLAWMLELEPGMGEGERVGAVYGSKRGRLTTMGIVRYK